METVDISKEISEYWDKFFRQSLTANCNHELREKSVFAGYNHAALGKVKTQFRSLQGQYKILYDSVCDQDHDSLLVSSRRVSLYQ